jgi:glyoxalase family protein
VRVAGIHHITAITREAQPNIDFYAGVLGLRLVKKTVNFDAPDMYHLYFGDQTGRPGSIMTFFEIPGVPPGRPGAGMIHRVSWRVASPASLGFWEARLAGAGIETERADSWLRFADPEGLGLELVADTSGEEPLAADSPDIPGEHRLLGFAGARAFSGDPAASAATLADLLGGEGGGAAWILDEDGRSSAWAYDPPPVTPGRPGGGTVHHIAWATEPADQQTWLKQVLASGHHPSPIMDRTYFRSIYFREPSGVLFELATRGPGFTIDEEAADLGTGLRLPPQYESRRTAIEAQLRPVAAPW